MDLCPVSHLTHYNLGLPVHEVWLGTCMLLLLQMESEFCVTNENDDPSSIYA